MFLGEDYDLNKTEQRAVHHCNTAAQSVTIHVEIYAETLSSTFNDQS